MLIHRISPRRLLGLLGHAPLNLAEDVSNCMRRQRHDHLQVHPLLCLSDFALLHQVRACVLSFDVRGCVFLFVDIMFGHVRAFWGLPSVRQQAGAHGNERTQRCPHAHVCRDAIGLAGCGDCLTMTCAVKECFGPWLSLICGRLRRDAELAESSNPSEARAHTAKGPTSRTGPAASAEPGSRCRPGASDSLGSPR